MDLDDLVRINRAWLYKEPEVSVLKASIGLGVRGPGVEYSLGVTFLLEYFVFT